MELVINPHPVLGSHIQVGNIYRHEGAFLLKEIVYYFSRDSLDWLAEFNANQKY